MHLSQNLKVVDLGHLSYRTESLGVGWVCLHLYVFVPWGGGVWRGAAGVSPPSRVFAAWKANHGELRLHERCAFQWEQESGPQSEWGGFGKEAAVEFAGKLAVCRTLRGGLVQALWSEWKQSRLLLARFCLETENHFSSMGDKCVWPLPHSGQVLPFHLTVASDCSREVLGLVATLKLWQLLHLPLDFAL